ELPRPIPTVKDAAASDAIIIRTPAEIHGGNLHELLPGVHRSRMIRSRNRMHGLTAVRGACPGKVLAGVAPDNFDAVPWRVEHLGGDASGIDHRVGAEVAGARLNVKLSVGPNRHQAVVPD